MRDMSGLKARGEVEHIVEIDTRIAVASEEVTDVVEEGIAETFSTEFVGEQVRSDQQASIVHFEIVFQEPFVELEESQGIDFGKVDRVVAGQCWPVLASIFSDKHLVLILVVYDRDGLGVDLGFEPTGFGAEKVGKDVFPDGVASRRDNDGDRWAGAESMCMSVSGSVRRLWTYCAILSLNLNVILADDACLKSLLWDDQGCGCRYKRGMKLSNGRRQEMARQS